MQLKFNSKFFSNRRRQTTKFKMTKNWINFLKEMKIFIYFHVQNVLLMLSICFPASLGAALPPLFYFFMALVQALSKL